MKKYFVISDVHGFYKEMKESLYKAGFRKTNPNHVLIILGDIFDRGQEAVKIYKFIQSLNRERVILVWGNHESLFCELLNKKYPHSYDFDNGTFDTFLQIANHEILSKNLRKSIFDEECRCFLEFHGQYNERAINIWEDIKNLVKNSDIATFIKTNDRWMKYFELDNFIFVHSFIPIKLKEPSKRCGLGYSCDFKFDPNWRSSKDWDEAIWGCPWEKYKCGLFDGEKEAGKILVCGHWHTSDFYKHLNDDSSYERKFGPIYFGENIIGIDGGTMWNIRDGFIHRQNVLVIEDGKIVKE